MRDNQRSDPKQPYCTCTWAPARQKSRQGLWVGRGRSCCDDGKTQAFLAFPGTKELGSCCARQDSRSSQDGSRLKIFWLDQQQVEFFVCSYTHRIAAWMMSCRRVSLSWNRYAWSRSRTSCILSSRAFRWLLRSCGQFLHSESIWHL